MLNCGVGILPSSLICFIIIQYSLKKKKEVKAMSEIIGLGLAIIIVCFLATR